MSLPGFWWVLGGLPVPAHSLIQVSSFVAETKCKLRIFLSSLSLSQFPNLLLLNFYISCGFRLGTATPSSAFGNGVP